MQDQRKRTASDRAKVELITEEPKEASLTTKLSKYYRNSFPYNSYFRWLSHQEVPEQGEDVATLWTHREFAFASQDNAGTEIFSRYRSFPTIAAFRESVIKRTPIRIEVGPEYNLEPRLRKKSVAFMENLTAVQREFVVDLDFDDYDDVRPCECKGATFCYSCWRLMIVAVQVLTDILKRQYGCSHILWVYSGRRGLHCWVSDPHMLDLPNTVRAALIRSLSLCARRRGTMFTGGMLPDLEVIWRLHLMKTFMQFCQDERNDGDIRFLQKPSSLQVLAEILPGDFGDRFLQELPSALGSLQIFKNYSNFVKRTFSNQKTQIAYIAEAVFRFTFPRPDLNVSKDLNHLLKSPFVIHPKTGNICTPVPPERLEDFEPYVTLDTKLDSEKLYPVNLDDHDYEEKLTVYTEFFTRYTEKLLEIEHVGIKQRQEEHHERKKEFFEQLELKRQQIAQSSASFVNNHETRTLVVDEIEKKLNTLNMQRRRYIKVKK
ncbi:hypothetical protein PCE1_000233 [Barthelona sp. PCE]